MKNIVFCIASLTLSLVLPAQAAMAPNNGPGSYDILLHSSCCYTEDPIAPDQDLWHAFFEAPETPAIAPGVTLTDTSDLTDLENFDLLYIATDQADDLSGEAQAAIAAWTSAGGILVINNHEGTRGGFSEFGASFGSEYEFTAANDPDGDNMEVTDPSSRILTTPNLLDNVTLSNWRSSVHGAFSDMGSAYSCSVDSVDGEERAPVLCEAAYGAGAIILIGFDPECGDGCHDGHTTDPESTSSGSEMWENLVLYQGVAEPAPIPTLSRPSILILALFLGLVGIVHFRRSVPLPLK